MKTLTISPAYGRDYTSAEEVIRAWESGKDFKQHSAERGTYVGIGERLLLLKAGYTYISLRFNKMTKQVVIPL